MFIHFAGLQDGELCPESVMWRAEFKVLPMQFLGGTNLLTGHTDEHWKAVRKAVAPSFSAGNMR